MICVLLSQFSATLIGNFGAINEGPQSARRSLSAMTKDQAS